MNPPAWTHEAPDGQLNLSRVDLSRSEAPIPPAHAILTLVGDVTQMHGRREDASLSPRPVSAAVTSLADIPQSCSSKFPTRGGVHGGRCDQVDSASGPARSRRYRLPVAEAASGLLTIGDDRSVLSAGGDVADVDAGIGCDGDQFEEVAVRLWLDLDPCSIVERDHCIDGGGRDPSA